MRAFLDVKNSKIKLDDLKKRFSKVRAVFDFNQIQSDLDLIEKEMNKPDFWQDQKMAKKKSQQASELRSIIEDWTLLEKDLDDAEEMLKLMPDEVGKMINDLEKRFAPMETSVLFDGKYDDHSAIISIHAGAGGTDAMDWAEMLLRMYLRFAEKKNWSTTIHEESRGDEAGIKSVSFEIRGKFAYGHMKSEAGVHRLVRISPFDAEGMRHTSFALVEIIPEIDEVLENSLEINQKDLRIDTFMSSGCGGQSVNTTYSAIRITHIPTNTVVTCQNERSQQQNKETALKVLKSRLLSRMIEEQKEKIDELKGGHKSPEWGNQIRSYVMHPYKMVKDHRTGFETSHVEDVLDGDLQEFIENFLRDKSLNK